MNIIIKNLKTYLDKNPKLKQWLWFLTLWLFGFAAVTIATYPIKFLIRFL